MVSNKFCQPAVSHLTCCFLISVTNSKQPRQCTTGACWERMTALHPNLARLRSHQLRHPVRPRDRKTLAAEPPALINDSLPIRNPPFIC